MSELIRGDVMVEWVELGEGWSGDYDEDDPGDEELLRFDVSVKGALAQDQNYNDAEGPDDWIPVDDASYCTRVPVTATPEERDFGLAVIMNNVAAELEAHKGVKHLCEWLSWLSLEEIRAGLSGKSMAEILTELAS